MLQLKKTSPLLNLPYIIDRLKIEEKQKIAELGCGSFGYFVYPIAKLVGKGGKVYAVDILKSALEEIRRKAIQENLHQIETVWSNLEVFKGTAIESSSLDAALLINILSQSEKKAEIVRESVRLLKRNGKLVIIEWKSGPSPFGPPADKRLKEESMRNASPQLGLSLTEEFSAGPHHYGLIFKKI